MSARAARLRRRLPRPTASAWRLGLLAGGLLAAAVNTGNNLVYLMFSLIVAALPISVAFAAVNLRRIDIDLRLPPAPRSGAPFAIDLQLTNPRRAPAIRSLAVTLVTDRGTYGPAVVERIDGGATLRVTMTARGGPRGPQRVLCVRLRSTFPLGLIRFEKIVKRSDEFLILPAASPVAALADRATNEPGAATLAARVHGTEHVGLRRGAAEDDARKVDWKVTARRGVLIVRETVGEGRREIDLAIETRRNGNADEARAQFEAQVGRIAGQARQVLEAGGVVRLAVDGERAGSHSGRGGLMHLLRRLARLVPTGADGRELPPLPPPPRLDSQPPEPAALRATAAGRAHRWSVLAAAAIAVTTLFTSGGIGPVLFGGLALSLLSTAFSNRFIVRERSVMDRLWKIAAVGSLFLFGADILWLRNNLLLASLGLLVFITVLVLYNARTVADDRRILLISFLQMVLASALTTEVALVLPLAGWLLASVHALLISTSLLADGKRAEIGARSRCVALAFGVGGALAAAAVVVFLLVPHLGTGTFRPDRLRPQRATGFSETTRLGDIGRIKQDGSKVMEVEVSGAAVSEDGLKWRGLALNEFDGRSWTRSYSAYRRLSADGAGRFHPSGEQATLRRGDVVTQNVRLEPIQSSVLFAAARPRQLVSKDFRLLGEDGFGNLEFRMKPARRVAYSVTSQPAPRDAELLQQATGADPEHVRELDLWLPDIDERVAELAQRITANTTTRYDDAVAIERWLANNLAYSLDVRDEGAEDPIAWFLFESRSGHCEYFATAMVVMARQIGIPSRFVTGYLRGEKSRFGRRYIVRQSDAHAWTEIYFPEVGWVPFDPTPPAGRNVSESGGFVSLLTYAYSSIERIWDDYLVGIDLDDQVRGLLVAIGGLSSIANRVLLGLAKLGARGPVLGTALAGAAILLWLGLRKGGLRRKRRSRGRKLERRDLRSIPAFYRQTQELLARHGLERRPGETPAELAGRSAAVLGRRAAGRLSELTQLYYRVRFDPATSERQVLQIARALVGDVREALAASTTRRRA